jgi:ABC-type transport system substrate-binding protein
LKRGSMVLSILLLISLVLVGCSSNSSSTTAAKTSTSTTTAKPSATTTAALTPKYGGTKVIYDSGPAGSIGYPPELTSDSTTAPSMVVEPLVKENSKGDIIPWLAESYTLASDQLSVTFVLRKGIKFHDGTDLNASIAKWNMDNAINAKKVSNWKSVSIIDDYTIRVDLIKWQNTGLSTFAGNNAWMISKAAFDKNWLDWV